MVIAAVLALTVIVGIGFYLMTFGGGKPPQDSPPFEQNDNNTDEP